LSTSIELWAHQRTSSARAISERKARGWRDYIDEGQAVTFCPDCAEREFGS
jgi:hypothetical protein